MDKIILVKEMEGAKKKAETLRKAKNKAQSLINDAKNRYVKEKTRAKSKKAAEEKDALLKSPRFKVLEDYYRFEDIQEAYGCGCITESERDRLEELWEEREAIKSKTVDGIYQDEVTRALHEAWILIDELWEDDIEDAYATCREFERQKAEADENARAWMQRQNEAYQRLFNTFNGKDGA